LDSWFTERLERHPERSPSELLVQLVYGGLRLREGYMAIHRRALEQCVVSGELAEYATYMRALNDTFGPDYVSHLEKWLVAERVAIPTARHVGREDAKHQHEHRHADGTVHAHAHDHTEHEHAEDASAADVSEIARDHGH